MIVEALDYCIILLSECIVGSAVGQTTDFAKMSIFSECSTESKATYKWTIPNFRSACQQTGEKLSSAIISIANTNWLLDLYPRGISEEYSQYMSLYLRLKSGRQARIKFQLSILDRNKRHYAAFEGTYKYQKTTSLVCGKSDFIKQKELKRYKSLLLPNDTLTICCEISPEFTAKEKGSRGSRKRKRSRCESEPESDNADGNMYEMYFDNKQYSDVIFLSSDSKCINAHKVVLISKSDVFANLFSMDIPVLSPDIVNVKDIDYEVLYEAIRFVYTGKLNIIEKYAMKLLNLADRFKLVGLKIRCEQFLSNNLSVANAVELYLTAEDYDLTDLKKEVKHFIALNIRDFIDLPDFQKLSKLYPKVVVEIVQLTMIKLPRSYVNTFVTWSRSTTEFSDSQMSAVKSKLTTVNHSKNMSSEVRGKALCMQSCYRWDLSASILESKRVGEKIISPVIPIHYYDFQIELYPKGVSKKFKKYMSIFLKLLSGYIKVKFNLSILNTHNKKRALLECSEVFDVHTGFVHGAADFIQQNELLNDDLFTDNGVLRIWCEVSFGIAFYEMPVFDNGSSRKRPRLQSSESSLNSSSSIANCNPFEKYFDNDQRSDVQFIFSDGRCIHAHMMILEHKTEAFSNLFQEDVSVSSPGIVNMKDIEYEVMYEVLRFIYTDKVENLDGFALKLLEPAMRFMLDDLKALCEKHLTEKLSVEDVIDLLILAEDCHLCILKKEAKQFIAANIREIVHLPQFETVITERPDVALQIIRCNISKQSVHDPINGQWKHLN
ncbi:uncharacterized protein LOC131668632 [Phymastichus coffea]|uniref:uncharacterized protein LOC131668632 n=1 Tax=Phymastichus coffea TaxID=108790 RepID=UPI00273B6F27|nr:uncharacterized protein LOC131668632 [Phymastichus coffea]